MAKNEDLNQDAAAMAEALAGIRGLEPLDYDVISGFAKFLDKVRGDDYQIVFKTGKGILRVLEYDRGKKSNPANYESGQAIAPGETLVLSESVQIVGSTDGQGLASELYVGDSRFFASVLGMAAALGSSGGLAARPNGNIESFKVHTAKKVARWF